MALAKHRLRERKREQTRTRLIEAALALFLKHGYDGTTIDDIADAANVSRRTFFHYFKSKEDVAVTWQDSFAEGLVAAIAAEPAGSDPLTMAERALIARLGKVSAEDAVALTQLIQNTPELLARDSAKYEGMERMFVEALTNRFPKKSDELAVRLAAMIVIGALRVSSSYFRNKRARLSPAEQAREVTAVLRKQIALKA